MTRAVSGPPALAASLSVISNVQSIQPQPAKAETKRFIRCITGAASPTAGSCGQSGGDTIQFLQSLLLLDLIGLIILDD